MAHRAAARTAAGIGKIPGGRENEPLEEPDQTGAVGAELTGEPVVEQLVRQRRALGAELYCRERVCPRERAE